jgi:hypothetical protein
MNRPEVRIIQSQEEQTQPANIDNWEAEQLLRKYGYENQQFSTREEPQQPTQPVNNLTFEEMVAQEEARLKEEEMRRKARMTGPKPTTFNGNRGYDSEVKYSSDEDTGFGFRIEITTDMKIPKY